MKIFEKDGRIHLQLMNLTLGKILFDFSVEKPHFEELRNHMLEHLKAFKMPEEGEEINKLLENISNDLEPKTHCCECTPGKHFERHMVHIQYPDCKCKKEDFALKRNPS